MTQSRNLAGAAEAVERAKGGLGNSATRVSEAARDTVGQAAEGAQQMAEDARDALAQYSHDSYDFVGERVRVGEDYARRHPMQALAIAAMAGAAIGFCFAMRAAPRVTGRSGRG